jgi:hypothetical protein
MVPTHNQMASDGFRRGVLIDRRSCLLGAASLLAICRADPSSALDGAPSTESIPVSSLPTQNFAARAFSGFATPGTTVFTSGPFKFLRPNPDNDLLVCATTSDWRDQEISSWAGRGTFFLRLSGTPGAQTALFMTQNNAVPGGDIRIGIVTGFDETKCCDPSCGNGKYFSYYVNTNVAGSPEGAAVGYQTAYKAQTLTFGCNGFEVYLKYNGQDLFRYTEWRLMNAGRMAIWAHQGYGTADVTATFLPPQALYSRPELQVYDPRDFGMRAVPAVTGAMTAGSNKLTLAQDVGFKVGDQVIVEIGGEAGRGRRNTVGVGGTWPVLSYANLAAMQADTKKPDGTSAYLRATGDVYTSKSGAWTPSANSQTYYPAKVVPLSLVAAVKAVSQDGKELTLSASAAATTAKANVWLDCLPSLFVLTQVPKLGAVLPPQPSNVSVAIPAGTWRLSNIATNTLKVASGLKIYGEGRTRTTLVSPPGVPCGAFDITGIDVDNVSISDMAYRGNLADHGFCFAITMSGNGFGGYPSAFTLHSPRAVSKGLVLRNIDGTNTFGRCVGIAGGAPLIENCTVTVTSFQQDYLGWQIQIYDSSDGVIRNCRATGAKLLKAFELFACTGSRIVNCNGTNALYATNSCSSWTLDACTTIIQAGAFFTQTSGAIDEPVININNHAFHSGSKGLIRNCNVIQQGYIDNRNNSLKAIQIQPDQTDCTIQGQYRDGAGCAAKPAGLFQAPNYDPRSAEYGAMAIMSDAPRTTVVGVRVIGAAIGPPGHSNHFGNISLLGADSKITNCIADVVHGGTQSGNQTNASFCR